MEQEDIPFPSLRSEDQLVLCCAQAGQNLASAARMRELLRAEIDWAYLLRTARRHGLLLLLYWRFIQFDSDAIPENTINYLHSVFELNSKSNLVFSKELLDILSVFEKHDIPAISLRGPGLSAARQTHSGLWEYRELNLLIRQQEVLKAQALLIARGYHLPFAPNGKQEAAFLKYHYQYIFYHSKPLLPHSGHPQVVLHWRLFPRAFPCQPTWDNAWNHSVRIKLDGAEVSTLSPADSLLMMCGFGAQELWQRLDHIYEVASIVVNQDLEWERVLGRARSSGIERRLFLGLSLAHDLLGVALPDKVRQRLQDDPVVKSLAGQVCDRMFSETEYAPSIRQRHYFRLRTMARWRDRVHYIFRTLTTASVREWKWLPRPDLFFPVYTLCRPLLLLGKYGLRLLGPRMPAGFENFAPTDMKVVEQMIALAEVGPEDVVYDLGCGDGRVVVASAKRHGARGIGIDIDPRRIAEARANARKEGVEHLVKFIHQDARTVDLSEATVLTMYVGWNLNLKLRPQLQAQLRAGARLVSLSNDMGDWPPDEVERITDSQSGESNTFYLWRIKEAGVACEPKKLDDQIYKVR